MPALIAEQLAATGATINILVPIIGGALLLAGIAAFVYAQVRRRRHAPGAAKAVEAPTAPTTNDAE